MDPQVLWMLSRREMRAGHIVLTAATMVLELTDWPAGMVRAALLKCDRVPPMPLGARAVLDYREMEAHHFGSLEAALAWTERVKGFLVTAQDWREEADQEDVLQGIAANENRRERRA